MPADCCFPNRWVSSGSVVDGNPAIADSYRAVTVEVACYRSGTTSPSLLVSRDLRQRGQQLTGGRATITYSPFALHSIAS